MTPETDKIANVLGTPNGNGIVFAKGVPGETEELLARAFQDAKSTYGDFEAVLIPLANEDSYNLQICIAPNRNFLTERISRASPVADFKKVVGEKFGS